MRTYAIPKTYLGKLKQDYKNLDHDLSFWTEYGIHPCNMVIFTDIF